MALKAQNSKWLNSRFFQAVFMQISMFYSMFDINICAAYKYLLLSSFSCFNSSIPDKK